MPQLQKTVKDLLIDALAEIELYAAEEAITRLDDGDVVFIDVRDGLELSEGGRIPGAIHASRGMLEFYADPDIPFSKDVFSEDKEFILYCAVGPRGVLATQRLEEMGFESVAALDGGFAAWKDAGGPVEEVDPEEIEPMTTDQRSTFLKDLLDEIGAPR